MEILSKLWKKTGNTLSSFRTKWKKRSWGSTNLSTTPSPKRWKNCSKSIEFKSDKTKRSNKSRKTSNHSKRNTRKRPSWPKSKTQMRNNKKTKNFQNRKTKASSYELLSFVPYWNLLFFIFLYLLIVFKLLALFYWLSKGH